MRQCVMNSALTRALRASRTRICATEDQWEVYFYLATVLLCTNVLQPSRQIPDRSIAAALFFGHDTVK
jgi:hypothetical protein